MTPLRLLAFGLAALVLAINLVLEKLLMALARPMLLVPGLADFHPEWNHGVSFSLLWQSGNNGQHLLAAGLAVVTVVVAVLAWRATNTLTAAGFGLIVGGALGNLVDRVLYNGVFDFLALHLGSLPLFVCNFSDIAISAGVVLLAVDGMWGKSAV